MTTTITNSLGRTYRVEAVGGRDVAVTSELGPSVCPPGEDLILAIQTELGLPAGPPGMFTGLPNVGEPDFEGDYEIPNGYISDSEQALETMQFAYAVYLKVSSETEQKVAKLAALITDGKNDAPHALARRLIASGEVTVA